MFGKKKPKNTTSRKFIHRSTPTIIADSVAIFGNVFSEGLVDIEGTIDGNVKAYAVIIRDDGTVNGDVTAESVQIYGKVRGLVKARNVTLYDKAFVEGVIMHESLSIEDGAQVDGKFKRVDKLVLEHQEDEGDEEIPFVEEIEAGEGLSSQTRLGDNIRLVRE